MNLLLAIVAVGCALGWFFANISFKTILCFMAEKGYTLPTDEELKACTHQVILMFFGQQRKR